MRFLPNPHKVINLNEIFTKSIRSWISIKILFKVICLNNFLICIKSLFLLQASTSRSEIYLESHLRLYMCSNLLVYVVFWDFCNYNYPFENKGCHLFTQFHKKNHNFLSLFLKSPPEISSLLKITY